MHFLSAATPNPPPKPFVQSKDFNFKRVFFCVGKHGRLFQQNRPIAVFPANCYRLHLYNLKQPSQHLRLPIHDDQLPGNLSLPLPLVRGRVPDLSRLKVKPFKHTPYIRVVVDADHHFAFAATHEVSHAFVVFKREIHAVASSLLVRGVHVMEGMSPIISLRAFKPRQVFDVGA